MSDLMSFKKNMEFLRMPLPSDSSVFGLQAGKAIYVMLAEGDAVTIKGVAALSTGAINSPAGLQSYSLSQNATLVIGPFAGRRKIAITPTAGVIDVIVQNATLVVLKSLLVGIFGQSNERSSIYPTLVYTSASLSGDGAVASFVTNNTSIISNNLPIGEVFFGTVTGAVPAAYNTSGEIPMTITGTYPNGVITYSSTATGTQTTPGTLTLNQKTTYPEMFASQKFPNDVTPIAPSTSALGGWWFGVEDALSAAGYQAQMVNGAIGSMSFVKHACGQVTLWTAGARYRNARTPLGNGDNGCMGELIRTSAGILLECTAGGDMVYATYSGSVPLPGTSPASVYQLDYIQTVAGGVTGGTEPVWGTTPAKGTTFVDNGITWTVRSPSIAADSDASIKSLNTGSSTPVCAEGWFGFDPLGLVTRMRDEMGRVRGVQKRIICLENAQSDTSAAQAWYQLALTYLGNYFASRGYIVLVGLSMFQPTSNQATSITNYNKLQAARAAALISLKAAWPNNVYDGPDLYALLGSVPGSGNLYLESDNGHPNENVHVQGRSGRAIVPLWTNAIKAIL